MADEWNGLRNERWLLEGLLNAPDVSDGLVQTGGDENGQQHERNAFHGHGHVRGAEDERRESDIRVPTDSNDGKGEQGGDGITGYQTSVDFAPLLQSRRYRVLGSYGVLVRVPWSVCREKAGIE